LQGLAKYVQWSANNLEEKNRKEIKAAEIEAKKKRIRMWTNYVPPPSDSKAIHDQNFTGKVCATYLVDSIRFLLSYINIAAADFALGPTISGCRGC